MTGRGAGAMGGWWWCGRSGRGTGGVWCVVWVIGRETTGGGGLWRPTPHLTSPLKGGRDELGKGEVGAGVGWFLPAQE